MLNKIIDLLKESPIVCPRLLLYHYQELKLTERDFIFLLYFMNQEDFSFNPKKMALDMNRKLPEIMDLVSDLHDRGFINVEVCRQHKVCEERINLDPLYQKLGFFIINGPKEEKQTNLFEIFEHEFGRTLSPMEYEIMHAWLEDFSEELIMLALKEATYNGVTNLRYIDKILHEWKKKGVQTATDVDKEKKKFTTKKETPKQLFDYDWLNEDTTNH